jgi:hypothetical protein
MRLGALAWLGTVALAAVALDGVAREQAWADGAVAVGSTGNVVRDGIAFGMAVDVPKDAAVEIAVRRCRTFEAKAAAERCQVVATFSGECFAIAYDPKPGTPGAGWGVGLDQLAANQKAVAMCEQAAGPARKGYCQVERFGCDTTGPKPKPDAGGQKDAAPDAKPDARPDDAKPSPPGIDAKAAPGAKPKDDAKASKDTKDIRVNTAVTEAPPPPAPQSAPKAVPTTAEPKARGTSSPLLPVLAPVLAMAGVGLAYGLGQHLRGRMKDGLAERQIITGGALAVGAAIAIKLLDLAGVGPTVAAGLAGLIALGAALLA